MVKRIGLGLLLAAGLAVGGWWWHRSRDEARLWRALTNLEKLVEKNGTESPIASAAKAREAAGYFVAEPDIEIQNFPVPFEGRGELASSLYQARTMAERLDVEIFDRSLVVRPDRAAAAMQFTARAVGGAHGEREQVIRQFTLTWVKTPDGWRIETVRGTEGLKRL